MVASTPEVQGDDTTTPGFLQVFDALRSRPGRRRYALIARMERRVARRLPADKHDGLQRGDIAEPPPVLDLALERPDDRPKVRRMLVEHSGLTPVWPLPVDEAVDTEETGTEETGAGEGARSGGESPGSGRQRGDRGRWWTGLRQPSPSVPGKAASASPPAPTDSGGGGDEDGSVTTDELYDLLAYLVDSRVPGAGGQPEPPRHRKPPPPPRFARLRSLLWLRRCDLRALRVNVSGAEVSAEHGTLQSSSQSQVEVVNELRRVRLESARSSRERLLHPEKGEAPPSRWEKARSGYAVRWRWTALAASRTSRWVTRISDRVTFGRLDEKLLTPLAFLVSIIVTATPFAVLGLAAQQLNELVGVLSGIVLTVAYSVMAFFLLLPWRPYRWLNRHRYVGRDEGRGDEDGSSSANHRERGIHVLNQLNDPTGNTGRISEDTRPPGVHRLAVNAFLDDLDDAYGASRRWRRKRHQRPVLVLEQERLDRVARYLVLLIEDERLRRGLPDPLLLVQIRDAARSPLIDGRIDTVRYPSLPEGEGAVPSLPSISRWTRARHAAGVLGIDRLVRQRVAPLPSSWGERSWRPEPVWVFTVPVLSGIWLAGTAGFTALVAILGTLVVPAIHPCVQQGLIVPSGINTKNGRCVGVTFGDFVFHERLEEVTERIREQNQAVDDSGAPYVTIAYLAELYIGDPADPSLSGPQGELLGLAFQQDRHNELVGKDGTPKIKLLIGNAGEGWSHAVETAQEIVGRAENERLGMDRPIGAVGFGHSVVPNSEAIQTVGDANIPMVGTTATYDDVAKQGNRQHNEFFFPLAPANSRIAMQSAHWAYHGVPWVDGSGVDHGLAPARTAVAIASAQKAPDGGEHEQYGPHLAEQFMSAFRNEGGRVWEGAGELGRDEYANGTLLYQSGELADDTTFREHLDRLCTESPPDLLYFAGRSADFTAFHEYFKTAGGRACVQGEMTILGGDDIAKFVTDEETRISRSLRHPVFYTPLAASGSWGEPEKLTGDGAQGFYTAVDELVRELYYEDGSGGGEAEPRKQDLPSIAHAAVASDAMLVVSRALPHTGLSPEELGTKGPLRWAGLKRIPFLRTQEDYELKRDQLLGNVQSTRNLTGMSGYIEFDRSVDGNWFADRMVQLVLVGPESDGNRQHVIHRCGMDSADVSRPDPGCV